MARHASGSYPTIRFIDKIYPAEISRDDRTGDEIAVDILSRLCRLEDAENEEADE